jgi:hypothetical protein
MGMIHTFLLRMESKRDQLMEKVRLSLLKQKRDRTMRLHNVKMKELLRNLTKIKP